MGVPLNQLINKFASMEKAALAKVGEDSVGNQNSAEVTGIPGSEHDAKVPAEAKKPDEEVAQGQPAGFDSTAGAVPGGDAKVLEEGKLTVDEPVLNPEKKPLESDEAYAKEASQKIDDILGALMQEVKKAESCSGAAGNAGAKAQAASAGGKKDGDSKKEEKMTGEKKAENVVKIDADMIAKIAEAVSVYNKGREAAEKAASASKSAKIKAIHDACIKIAQDQGLTPEEAQAAADNVVGEIAAANGADAAAAADAGAAAADAGAADAAAADAAAADAGAADAAGAEAALPEDVTVEELGEAVVDLVEEGKIDVDTAKSIIDELASADAGGADISDDEAAQIVADGLESGEITPEQAEAIAAEIDGGAAEAADDAAAADDAEAAGAAAAEAAVADAKDEAAGAEMAENAIKSAQAAEKVANSPFLSKVAEKLAANENVKKASAESYSDKYAKGFTKRAMELGVDPSQLARYALSNMSEK